MKQFVVLFIASLFTVTAFAQKPPVKFTAETHSFGKIKLNKPVTKEFVFQNTSNQPVVIEFATAECGCTTPDYPKQPIAKGQTAKIKVTFNAASVGTFKKSVTVKFVKYNAPVILTIDGEVTTPPAAKGKVK